MNPLKAALVNLFTLEQPFSNRDPPGDDKGFLRKKLFLLPLRYVTTDNN